ncbi:NDR1/HIN1-like protein 26 [Euphorbia lathyris]|uniref:NDR1/HIN1-like protein 26 n=1 Tax=Euphorbia lathyris TaxID=212925 RepID=UPI003313F2AC
MNNPGGLPVQSRPIKRHHTARYIAHKVHESLTTRVSKVICGTFFMLLLILGLVAFILWISLRPHRPRIHMQEFTIPGLSQSNGFENAEIIFNVTARNSNQHVGFHYGKVEGSVYYKDQRIGSTRIMDPFYQDPKSTTIWAGVFSGATLTVSNSRWIEFQSDRALGTVMFRLDITSQIRFKVSTWGSKNHTIHANCDVGVGPDGSILSIYKDKKCPLYFT